jgi:hypothetical protein
MDNKFVPVYYVFRTGNFTEDAVKDVLGDLTIGIGVNLAVNALGVFLTALFLALLFFSIIKVKLSKSDSVKPDTLLNTS